MVLGSGICQSQPCFTNPQNIYGPFSVHRGIIKPWWDRACPALILQSLKNRIVTCTDAWLKHHQTHLGSIQHHLQASSNQPTSVANIPTGFEMVCSTSSNNIASGQVSTYFWSHSIYTERLIEKRLLKLKRAKGDRHCSTIKIPIGLEQVLQYSVNQELWSGCWTSLLLYKHTFLQLTQKVCVLRAIK